MALGSFKKIDRYPFSELEPGRHVLSSYRPEEGKYAGRVFIIDYLVPSVQIAKGLEELSAVSNVPGKALFTSIHELSDDVTVDIEKTTDEFRDIFRAAIEGNEGSVLVTPEGRLVANLSEL